MIHVLHVVGKLNAFGGTPAKLYYQVTRPSRAVRYTICCIEKDGHMADSFRRAGVEVITLNRPTAKDPRQLLELVSLIRERSVDVVHTHFARSNTYGRLAAIITGRPVMLSEHGIFRHTSPVLNLMDNLLNLFTRFNVSNSRATLESVRKNVFLNRKNMSVIHNGVPEIQGGNAGDTPAELKERAGLHPDDYLVLNVGSHIPLRNQETLIRAVHRVRDAVPNIRCVLIGDGKTHPYLKSEAARLDLGDRVLFWKRRPREEVHRFLPAADLFVNPTLLEGFGIATVEAMLKERAVICARSGSLPELMDDGEHGLFFPPGDDGALARVILDLHGNPEKARKLGESARRHAARAFSMDRFAKDFEELYRSAAEGAPKGGRR